MIYIPQLIQMDFNTVMGNANRFGGNTMIEVAAGQCQDWVVNTNLQ